MNAEAVPIDFASLKGRIIQRLWVLALDRNGVLDLGSGDVQILLDDGTEVAVAFDYDRGLVLARRKATLPPYETLSGWFELRESCGVIVRVELPESNLRRALYGATINEIVVENDP